MLISKLDRGEGLAEMQLQRNQVVLGALQLCSSPVDVYVLLTGKPVSCSTFCSSEMAFANEIVGGRSHLLLPSVWL